MHADTLYKEHDCACELSFEVCGAHNTVSQMKTYYTHSRVLESSLILNMPHKISKSWLHPCLRISYLHFSFNSIFINYFYLFFLFINLFRVRRMEEMCTKKNNQKTNKNRQDIIVWIRFTTCYNGRLNQSKYIKQQSKSALKFLFFNLVGPNY